jgi:tetratricopeptide (TPR) repeat protein
MSDLTADQLRGLLWETAATGDLAALVSLCQTHRDSIVRHFPQWRTIPQEVRSQPDRANSYIQAMIAVARVFEERLGDPSLIRLLTGSAQDNPLLRWQKRLEAAQQAMEAIRYQETIRDLEQLLEEVRSLQGSGAVAYLPVTCGLLGECYFQTAQAEKAVGPTEEALRGCRRARDAEGVITYLGNLYEIHRYRGAAQRAAESAEELSRELAKQGQADEAERYRRQAILVRQGEPLNRVIVNLDGKRMELDEVLAGKPGRVQFAFERNRLTLRPATALTGQGEKQASQGRFEAALKLFQQAAEADPYDPQCRYQAGLTLLYLGRYAEAVSAYDATEERAPSWFHCRSNAWLARQMVKGKVSQEMFQLWHVAEDGPLNPEQKLNVADRALKLSPDLALLHHLRGKSLRALNQASAAESAYREGLACAAEPDIQTRLLVDLAAVISDPAERHQLLEQAVALNGNILASATARIVLAFE